jgi:hypothetical protein
MIDSKGISISDTKLDSRRNFPLSQFKKGWKSCVGLVNYFRDHVRGHSDLAKPLQDILEGYSKSNRNHKNLWTDYLIQCYETRKEPVSNRQKLNFMRTDSPSDIILLTDASDYGIGGIFVTTYRRSR